MIHIIYTQIGDDRDYGEVEKQGKCRGEWQRYRTRFRFCWCLGRDESGLVEQPALDGYRLFVAGGNVQSGFIVELQDHDGRVGQAR
jgi:hypothetical protein